MFSTVSIGKGVGDSLAFIFTMIKKTLVTLLCAGLVGCSTVHKPTEEYTLTVRLQFSDADEIQRLWDERRPDYPARVGGFYDQDENKCYVQWDNYYPNQPTLEYLGHEILHAIGKTHPKGSNIFSK